MANTCEIPLADTPCGACGCEPAWLWPNGDVLCASCYHEGKTPKQVKTEISDVYQRVNIGEKALNSKASKQASESRNGPMKRSKRQHPEADFGRQVDELLKRFGWTFYFTWHSIHSPAGFPDRVAVRLSRLLFIELKSAQGKITPEQQQWLDLLKGTGKVEVFVWRPSDWGEIVEILR